MHIYEQREREREREGHTLKNVAIFDRRPTNLKASDFDANTHAHRDPVDGKDPGYHLDMYNKILYVHTKLTRFPSMDTTKYQSSSNTTVAPTSPDTHKNLSNAPPLLGF